MRTATEAHAHTLLLCATGLLDPAADIGVDASPAVAHRLIAMADRHAVLPLVASRHARGLGLRLPASARDMLAALHSACRDRNAAVLDTYAAIVQRLQGAGIGPLPLKGVAYLLDGLHGDPAARLFGDIDLLVPPDEAREASKLLVEFGYRVAPDDGASHHLPPLFPARSGLAPVRIEVHHRPRDGTIESLGPDGPEMLASARRIRFAGGATLVPSPAHQRDHFLIHAAWGGAALSEANVLLREVADLAALTNAAPFATAPAAREAMWRDRRVRRYFAIAQELSTPQSRRLDTRLVHLKTQALSWPTPLRQAAAAVWRLSRPARRALQ